MTTNDNFMARLSLSLLWISTGVVSLFFARDIGYQVLSKADITGWMADATINIGSILDIVIGIWLLIGKNMRLCYFLQLLTISIYSLLLTLIDPRFWLHPFGPLTKNIPIFVMVFYLYKKTL